MNQGAMIVSLISVLACLFLVTRNSELLSLTGAAKARLALIWLAIIIGVVLVIQYLGLAV